MSSPPRRTAFPPLRPGEHRLCPYCGDAARSSDPMTDHVPPTGYWGTVCVVCGELWLWRAHYGDREEDVFWVVDPQVPDAFAREMRAVMANLLRHRDERLGEYAPDLRRTVARWRKEGLL